MEGEGVFFAELSERMATLARQGKLSTRFQEKNGLEAAIPFEEMALPRSRVQPLLALHVPLCTIRRPAELSQPSDFMTPHL